MPGLARRAKPIARLYGKSLRETAQELITVAHPDFREDLRAAARRRNL